ncbi:hypothetical protein CVS40_6677 [Lucilia cuprina]|nr:hypothetical protein CVS40_6677 [Lucilia cuprina]
MVRKTVACKLYRIYAVSLQKLLGVDTCKLDLSKMRSAKIPVTLKIRLEHEGACGRGKQNLFLEMVAEYIENNINNTTSITSTTLTKTSTTPTSSITSTTLNTKKIKTQLQLDDQVLAYNLDLIDFCKYNRNLNKKSFEDSESSKKCDIEEEVEKDASGNHNKEDPDEYTTENKPKKKKSSPSSLSSMSSVTTTHNDKESNFKSEEEGVAGVAVKTGPKAIPKASLANTEDVLSKIGKVSIKTTALPKPDKDTAVTSMVPTASIATSGYPEESNPTSGKVITNSLKDNLNG